MTKKNNEIEKQKQMVLEAQKSVEKEAKKLRLETMLSKNLSTELEKEKQIAVEAQELYKEKTNELEVLSNQLAKYLSPQVYQSIFSGKQEVNLGSKRKKTDSRGNIRFYIYCHQPWCIWWTVWYGHYKPTQCGNPGCRLLPETACGERDRVRRYYCGTAYGISHTEL